MRRLGWVGCGLFGCWAIVGCAHSAPAETPSEATPGSDSAAPPAVDKPSAINAGQCSSDESIDDFEDGDNKSASVAARGGYWYTYSDPSSQVSPEGTFAPTTGGAHESSYSGRMSGHVGTQQYPYVGIGVSLTDPKAPYDASCCRGVSFWGKKNGEGISTVRLKVGDWQTVPEGGSCKECYNDFGADFTFTDEWQEFSIDFSEMRQEPYWGEPKPAIDTSALYQLQWQVKENDRPFDIQIDDVRFVGCGSAAPVPSSSAP